MNKDKEFLKKIFEFSLFEKDINKNKLNLIKKIRGKSFLIFGAAGSIGSSYVKELIKYNPKKLLLVDINENTLVELVRELRSNLALRVDIEVYCQDILSDQIEHLFKKY